MCYRWLQDGRQAFYQLEDASVRGYEDRLSEYVLMFFLAVVVGYLLSKVLQYIN